MKQILIDTNAYVAFKRGDPDSLAVLQQASQIAVNAVVLGELHSGFAVGARAAENRRELAEFLALPAVTIVPIDHDTALQYAIVYSTLRKAGTPIPTNDMWIAATALQYGLAIFSMDRHFSVVAGVRSGASLKELGN